MTPHSTGESVAFCLRLRPGCEQEYRRRHDAIWPGMATALSGAGILHFEIFLEAHHEQHCMRRC